MNKQNLNEILTPDTLASAKNGSAQSPKGSSRDNMYDFS